MSTEAMSTEALSPKDPGQVIASTSSFRLTIEDDKIAELGLWTQVSGLEVSWASCEHKVGDNNDIWVCAGRVKYNNLTLTRPVCKSSAEVQRWLKDTSRDTKPCTAGIALVDADGSDLMAWKIRACFPLSWKLTPFETTGTKPVIETLQLVHSGFLEDSVSFSKKGGSATHV